MPNEQFPQSNDPYWYPQLPDGYNEQERNRQRHGRGQQGPIPFSHPRHPQQQHGGGPNYGQHHGGQGGFPGFPSRPPSWPGNQQPFPPTQQGGNQPPQSPPPNWTPEYPDVQTFAVDPGAISGCMYRFTYVWLSRRQGFWFFPVFVGRTSVAGYRWNSRRRRWEYLGLDLNQINSFTCI